MECFYKSTTAFCQKEFQKAVLMQERQLVPFSVSSLHFLYIVLVQARTGFIFAVARRKHGQDPEVDLYHPTPLLGVCQVCSRWAQHGRGSSWVVLFLWTHSLCHWYCCCNCFLIPLLFPANSYLSLCSLPSVPPNSPLQPPARRGGSEWHMDSTGALN